MNYIEKKISPLIEQQFPSLYREEFPIFISFVKAYYEWLENNFQEIVVDNTKNFFVNDTITQGDVIGKIVSINENYLLVENKKINFFSCEKFCNNSQLISSSSGGVAKILEERKCNAIYFSRRLSELRDIDRTIDSFILQFKKQFLPNIQFTTATNKELFIKNSLDFYRSKGTERAIDLFFKLVHGIEAKVYTPGDDLFRLSDNEWVNVQYLEIQPNDTNIQMVGHIIIGSISGATAYVERLVRVKKDAHFINVLYITNVTGDFQTGEQVYTTDLAQNVTTKILGSLTRLEILSSDSNFSVGEEVIIRDGSGRDGTARVLSTRKVSGSVDFELLSGGWGYTSNAIVLSSDRVLKLDNIENTNTSYYFLNDLFERFETIRQDILQVEVTDDVFFVGDEVNLLNSNSEVIVYGNVLEVNNTTPANTILKINYFGNSSFESIITITGENSQSSNVTSIVDISPTANVIADSSSFQITYNTAPFAIGDHVVQRASIHNIEREIANGTITKTVLNANATYTSTIEFNVGAFRTDLDVIRLSDNYSVTPLNFSNALIGIINPTESFYNSAYTYGSNSRVSGHLSGNFAFEKEAQVQITGFRDVQTIENAYASDTINTIDLSAPIHRTDYNLSLSPTAGFANIIADATPFTNLSIGSISLIAELTAGEGYPVSPYFVIYEPKSYHLERYDYVIEFSGAQSFRVGEIITGQTSGARARILKFDSNNRILHATRISLDENGFTTKDFQKNENIRGNSTNTLATITRVYEQRRENRSGLNAVLKTKSQSGFGFITEVDVMNSGFGYVNGEIVTLTSTIDSSRTAIARVIVERQGKGEGYHRNRKSFLSSDKYIQDSDYYQEYSYEVLTALPFEVYRDTLIKVLHVAGTKPFGSYVSTEQFNLNLNISNDIVEIT